MESGPLFGTFLLVLCSLSIAVPIGVLAGVYLNEYARDNWAARIINLAVIACRARTCWFPPASARVTRRSPVTASLDILTPASNRQTFGARSQEMS